MVSGATGPMPSMSQRARVRSVANRPVSVSASIVTVIAGLGGGRLVVAGSTSLAGVTCRGITLRAGVTGGAGRVAAVGLNWRGSVLWPGRCGCGCGSVAEGDKSVGHSLGVAAGLVITVGGVGTVDCLEGGEDSGAAFGVEHPVDCDHPTKRR